MEMQQFDALARHVGEGSTRRRLLGLCSSTALSGLLVTRLIDDVEAGKGKKKKKKSCKKKKCGVCQTCSKGKCLAAADGTVCPGGTCTGGTCRPVAACPSAQVCALSETCCPAGITTLQGVTYCGSNQQEVCSCPAGERFCTGTAGSQCCLSGDSCAQTSDGSGVCVSESCSADNDFCSLESAFCGETCLCITSTSGANLCADFAEFFECPVNSECSTDAQCAGDDVCVDVSCRCGGGTLGTCLPPCAANVQRATGRKVNHPFLHDRVGPLR